MLKLKDFRLKEIETDGIARLRGGQGGGPKGEDHFDSDSYGLGTSTTSCWTSEGWDWDSCGEWHVERDDYHCA